MIIHHDPKILHKTSTTGHGYSIILYNSNTLYLHNTLYFKEKLFGHPFFKLTARFRCVWATDWTPSHVALLRPPRLTALSRARTPSTAAACSTKCPERRRLVGSWLGAIVGPHAIPGGRRPRRGGYPAERVGPAGDRAQSLPCPSEPQFNMHNRQNRVSPNPPLNYQVSDRAEDRDL